MPIKPVPFKRVRQCGRRRFNAAEYSAYKKAVGYCALKVMGGASPISGAVKIAVEVYKDVPRDVTSANYGDGDNFLKAVMDALEGICYENDAQIVVGSFEKKIGEPRVEIILEAL